MFIYIDLKELFILFDRTSSSDLIGLFIQQARYNTLKTNSLNV